ncbi:hypothetical protein LVB77_11355 [Lysobacter sp. 5GHs7-4]|uniref:hypothetical protein n=1 Tax=Lysobacter sp. 5GHs7-4 TaxID=2904253 RepID=UPI001E3E3877|nr:hypothetical protein [Lysobacter sp. 5GHs7-4]UHQ21289.1 hypothetical protein LVB77_11355 [Lysobacter sp. 5GHs7-4]
MLALVSSRNWLPAIAGTVAYLLLIVAHEAGHAWVARRNGLYVHALHIYPMHGLCEHECARTPGQDIAVAWGGVGAQLLLLALAVAIGLQRWPEPAVPVQDALVVAWGALNLMTIALNLAPVAPLDGARAWKVLAWWRQRWRKPAREPRPAPPRHGKREDGKVVALDAHRRRRRKS